MNPWIIGTVIAVIGIVALVVLSPSEKEQEQYRQKQKERYVAALVKWIKAKHPSITAATTRKEIAECAYDQDSSVLYYRAKLKAREEKENEGRIIVTSRYLAYGDFLTDLDSYVNGGDGKIMQDEADMIDDAIEVCLKKK